jgi:hypothetical protein
MFFLKPRYQGGGFGAKAFAEQVQGCIDAGVDKITTLAGKGKLGGIPMNGYYTWARLGYDAPLYDDFKKKLPPNLKGAQTVQDLMATKEGRDHWKNKGYMTSMTFDLGPGSKSLDTLNRYRAEKNLPAITVDPERHQAIKQARAESKRLTEEEKQKKAVEAVNEIHSRWAKAIEAEGIVDPESMRADVSRLAGKDASPEQLQLAYGQRMHEIQSTVWYQNQLEKKAKAEAQQ